MATISGNVFFSPVIITPTNNGVANIPIVLQNTSTGAGLVVLTNASGAFSFTNVTNGSYRLVEAWGTSGGVATPGDFSTAAVIPQPTPNDPPVSAITSPPTGTDIIYSMSPNTLFLNVTADVSGLIFRDGPYQENPVTVNDVTLVGSNLITAASNGTWGTLADGTAVASYAPTAPYPGIVPGFTFIAATPNDGSYTVTNTTNLYGQGFVSDHTSGDETGRLQVINGANPGALFFDSTVNVLSNTYYQFSTWMINLTGGALPQLGFRITTVGGTTIFQNIPSAIPFTDPRTWNEIATFFNSGNNTQLKVQFFSNGPAAGGNDYAVDDIFLSQATIDDILTSTKLVDKEYSDVGETIKYTVVLKNTGASTISNLIFKDTIPSGTSFIANTLSVNNNTQTGANPTPPNGYTLGSPFVPMAPGATLTISFNVLVNTIPSPNPIVNSARADYGFAPISGGVTVANAVLSNNVLTTVNHAEISTTKSRDLGFVTLGDIITYTIPMNNFGTTLANNVVFTDTIPNGTTLVTDSVYINGTPQTGANPTPPTGVNVGTIPSGSITTLSFQVKVTSVPVPNPIPNTGTIRYNYTSDPSVPTIKSASANTNTVTSQFNQAVISSLKTTSKTYANVGDTITYTITITNTGNVSANNIVFTDTIPNDTTFVTGSVKVNGTQQASLNPNPPGFIIPSPASPINPNSIITITYDVKVNTIPSPNPIPNSATTTATFTIDPTTTPTRTSVTAVNTNIVNTTVNNANLGNISKSVNKGYATCGDILTYTITIPNSGNTAAFNVVLRDTIPTGTSLVSNSVTVNSVTQPAGTNPQTGITVGTISNGAIATVTFQVKVNC